MSSDATRPDSATPFPATSGDTMPDATTSDGTTPGHTPSDATTPDDTPDDATSDDASGTGGPADTGEDVPVELLEIRRSIDNIDAALVYLLAERFSHTQRVGRLKARYGLPPSDPEREAVQIARLRALAAGARLDPDFAEKFLQFLVEEVIRHHRAIARAAGEGAEDTVGDAAGGAVTGADERSATTPDATNRSR